MLKQLTAAALFVLIANNPVLAFGDWPQWRGPQRDGISTETGLVHDFPEGPRMLWNHAFGKGFSGLSIVDGLIYTMHATNAEYAVCLFAADGKEKWTVRTGKKFRDAQGGDGPRATPTVDGDRVFVLGANGRLMALNRMSGEVLWVKHLIDDLGGNLPNWGYSNSPLISGGLLLVSTGARAGGSLVGMRPESGEVVWRSSSSGAGYASPIEVNTPRQKQAIFFTERGLEGVHPEDGRKLWEFPWQTPLAANSATPVLVGPGKLFISSGYGMGSALVRIPEAGDKPDVLWKTRKMISSFSTPIWYRGNIYGFHDQVFECLDTDGRVRWEQRGLGMGTVIGADGKLFILGEQGRLIVARASRQRFQELGSARVLKGKCWTGPSLSDGVLYLRNERYIAALDIKQPIQTDGG